MARKKKKKPQRRPKVEVNVPELDKILDKATQETLSQDESQKVKTAVHAMAAQLTPKPRTSEKAATLDGGDEDEGNAAGDSSTGGGNKDTAAGPEEAKKPRPGHGRNGAKDYVGSTIVKPVLHAELTPKCVCPGCQKGKVYPLNEPKTLVRIVGMPPVQATKFELQRLRCNLCGEIYTATAPEGIGEEKYDASVASMLAMLKYGSGTPWYRIEKLQQQMGIPLPQTTQWDLVNEAADKVVPVYQELVRQGAQGSVMYRDDTKVRILEELERPEGQDPDRTGLNTTGIVSKTGEHLIALFFSGPQHAGENMCDLLDERQKGLPSPTMMSDALSSNDKLPPGFKAVLCNCLTHGRRQFVNVYESFPDDCRYVIEELGRVYWHDDQARQQGLDDQQRLTFHQEHSKPVMDRLKTWMLSQFDEPPRVEKNSGLGKAINYFLKRWDRLTRFLEHPGAPLDSNIVERALKKAVLLRKNSLFYKTQHGADVGDLFLTLIHTCELNHVNAFQYLTELQRHVDEIRTNPSAWLPWNYHLQLRAAPD